MLKTLMLIAAAGTIAGVAAAPASARDWHHPHHRVCHWGPHHHRYCR